MIILTAAQAAQVRGISPTDRGAALEPAPLKDGTFYLGDEVLNDPAHADVAAILKAGTKVASIPDANRYFVYQTGDTRAAYMTKNAPDTTAVTSKAIPTWDTVGVRK